jgi:hypothetical protein
MLLVMPACETFVDACNKMAGLPCGAFVGGVWMGVSSDDWPANKLNVFKARNKTAAPDSARRRPQFLGLNTVIKLFVQAIFIGVCP